MQLSEIHNFPLYSKAWRMLHQKESLHYLLLWNVERSERIMLLHPYCKINSVLIWRWKHGFPGHSRGQYCPVQSQNELMKSETSLSSSSSTAFHTLFLLPCSWLLFSSSESVSYYLQPILYHGFFFSNVRYSACSIGNSSGSCQARQVVQVDHP